jgi:hypothetical protein
MSQFKSVYQFIPYFSQKHYFITFPFALRSLSWSVYLDAFPLKPGSHAPAMRVTCSARLILAHLIALISLLTTKREQH